jgi:SAM-dependent methyltransferase
MYHSIYDFKDFYNSTIGGVVKHILRRKIRSYWDNVKGLRVVGIGYTQPYLDLFMGEAERCISISPAAQGSYPWPTQEGNLTVLAEETELPIETNSVDRVLLVHSLEYAELPKSNLQEIFRILKSNGRLIVLAPNRRGLWSRAEWSPYGHGTPYSGEQLKMLLRDNLFVYEQSCTALYTPPLRWNIIRRSFEYFEAALPHILPRIGGVHMVEVSKQVYSGTLVGADSKVIIRARASTAATAAISTRVQASE